MRSALTGRCAEGNDYGMDDASGADHCRRLGCFLLQLPVAEIDKTLLRIETTG